MNKKRIEQLIPIAMELIKEKEYQILNQDKKLPSNYAGYVKSYGPTIKLSGLCQAVAFNEKGSEEVARKDKEKVERWKINKLLLGMLKKIGYPLASDSQRLIEVVEKVSKGPVEKRKFQNLLLEAIIACKLAMLTFPQIKGGGED